MPSRAPETHSTSCRPCMYCMQRYTNLGHGYILFSPMVVFWVQYTEALTLDTCNGESDTDTLRLKAGVVVDLLDWALPDASPSSTPCGTSPASTPAAMRSIATAALRAVRTVGVMGKLHPLVR